MNGLLLNVICAFTIANTNPNIEKAQQTLDALYQNYAAPNTCLLRENYPFDQDSKATYLASEEQAKRRNEYSYLWPYSGTFSAVNALLESTGNKKYKKLLENKVLPGLEEYFDTRREPFAYSSYISSQPLSDRFYDDNVWLGIDFTDFYRMTGKQAYLEKAKLMGYADYASYVLEDRMAKNEENVYRLLNQIWTPAVAKAKEELVDIQAEIKKEGANFTPEGWDWRYYFEKAKKAKFSLDENEIRPYLELNNVRDGAFYVANKLYGITFSEINDIPKPHEEAQAFECKDKDGSHLGVLYMDFFPRSSKRAGAWCGTYRSQTYRDGKRLAPVVTIVCNFTKPSSGQPALLSADEASTLFHEFGHALHNLFKDVRFYGVSGVPRDFVELPSQVMEHWVFEPEVLKVYAKHYQTGEVIPSALIEKLDKSGKYGQGFATTEYLAASLLDMDYHVLKEIPGDMDIVKFETTVLKERGLPNQIPPRYRTTYFNHIMNSGYTAGYYSYIWAEVLDSDAFEAYRETGDLFNQEVASRFRRYILTPGGIDDAMNMYKNFRGKEPGIEPLLRNRGL